MASFTKRSLYLSSEPTLACLKYLGAALEKEHAKDVLLELGGVHPAAEDVGRGEEVVFELG
jgi:hypothetical protein